MLSLSLFPLNTYKYMQVKLIISYHSHVIFNVSFNLHLLVNLVSFSSSEELTRPPKYVSGNKIHHSITRLNACMKLLRLIYFTTYACAASCIVLCGDVELSRGPIAVSDTPKCPLCLKITKTDDACLPCTSCKKDFHLMSLGPDFDSSGHCHMSSSDNNMSLDDLSEDEIDLPSKLQEIVNNCGLKLMHQNIQSPPWKIDQLRLLLSKLKSSIHIFGQTETW